MTGIRRLMSRLMLACLFLVFTDHSILITAVAAAETPHRIISLAPNMTEMLYALGLGDRIVGVTTFCDYPNEAKNKPKVGGMSNPSLETVVSMKPDIVVMTTDGNPREFEERLRSLRIKTYVSWARRLSELPQQVRELGAALGAKERGDRLADSLQAELSRHRRSAAAIKGRKVLFIVWPEPLIAAGPETVIDDAITLLGAENIAGKSATAYPKYSIEEILRHPPDVIVIGKAMGDSDIKKASEGLLRRLRLIPAVREGRVYFVGDDLYRLGPRTLRGIDELSEVLRK